MEVASDDPRSLCELGQMSSSSRSHSRKVMLGRGGGGGARCVCFTVPLASIKNGTLIEGILRFSKQDKLSMRSGGEGQRNKLQSIS